MNKPYILKDLDKKRVVFRSDYPINLKKNIDVVEHKYFGKIRKIIVRKFYLRNLPNIRRQIIYCRKGDEEYAYKQYMKRLHKEIYNHIKTTRQNARTKKINEIRMYFGLNKVNGIKL